jgi:type IV secretory pathway TraG/TraD family ATPase VirD4
MAAFLHSLNHGTRSLEIAYLLVQIPMLIALRREGAAYEKYLKSPLVAAPLMLLGGLVLSFVPESDHLLIDILRISFGSVLFAALGFLGGTALAKDTASGPAKYRRGAVVSSAPSGAGRRETEGSVTLAGVPVSPEDETKHFKLIGTTGTGKSTAIREMLTAALARGDRVIIADPDGGYLARFHDAARGDVILNPFDGEGRKWDLFGEITNDYDVEQLARSLIPDSGDDGTWSEYARTFLIALVQQAVKMNHRKDGDLYYLLTRAPASELKELLAGTVAGPFLEPGNEKMFSSIRSVTSSAVRALQYTTRQDAEPFSVRQWVRSGAAKCLGGNGGVLFFPYKAGEIAALRSIISAWMRIAIFEAMDREEADQHLWFVIDELDALGEIDGLKDALARLRKFGGRCILGFQSIAQVSGTYGKGVAETIVENCGNTLILRCSASEHGGTSEFASKLIGQREVMHTAVSKTRRSHEWRTSTTATELMRIEPAIMASQIERLADLEGYLKLASIPDWCVVKLAPVSGPTPMRVRRPATVTSPAAVAKKPLQPSSPAASSARPAAGARRARKDKAGAPQIPLPVPERSSPIASSQPESPVTPAAVSTVQKSPGTAQWPN